MRNAAAPCPRCWNGLPHERRKGTTVVLTGHCHCGNIRVGFETRYTPADLPLRVCQCSFCRAHGAVAATDPRGRLTITVNKAEQLTRYRFGLGITDFLVCANCGVFVAALMEIDGRHYASLNTNTLELRAQLHHLPQPVDYSGETAVARRARRERHWTPADFRQGGG